MKSIRPSEILEWLRELEKTHGTSVQSRAFHIVQSTFDMAVADGMRKDNPAKSPIIPRIEIGREERDPWSAETVWSVIGEHSGPYRPLPLLAAGCGMRQGEVFGVAVEDFDFENGKVNIVRQIARVGRHVVFKLPKGDKTRTAPLSPGVARTIEAFMEAYPPVATTLPWMEGRDLRDPVTAELLFIWRGQLLAPPLAGDARTNAGRGRQKTADGKNLRMSVYNTLVWKVALARAGVIPPPINNERGALLFAEPRDDGMHALRHYYSTTLQDGGVSLAGVMEFLGHSRKGVRLPVTVGVYSHVTEETYEAARTAIDRDLFRLRSVQDRQAGGTETEQAVSQ